MEAIPKLRFLKSSNKNLEFEIFPLSRLFARDEKLPVPLHVPQRLEFFNVLVITRGSGVHFIDFEPYTFTAGDIIFVSKGQAQAFKASPDHDGFLLLFTESFVSKNLIDADVLSFYRLYNYHLQFPVVRPDKTEAAKIKGLVENIYTE